MKSEEDEHITELLDELETDPDWEERWAQEEMRWEYHPEMVEPLLARLDVDDHRTRRRVVTALGWIRDERAVDPLITVLRREQAADIRGKAATALGLIGCGDALDPLLDAFETASSYELRWRVIDALGELGADEELIDYLFEYEGEDAEKIRLNAITALGCSEDAFTARRKILDHGTPEERSTLAYNLRKCGQDRELEMLLDLLDDPDTEVRTFASQSIGYYISLNNRDFEADGALESVRRFLGLSSGGDQRLTHAIQQLVNRTDDRSSDVRRHAILALRDIGSKDLLGEERELVRRTLIERRERDESEAVRDAAEHALQYM